MTEKDRPNPDILYEEKPLDGYIDMNDLLYLQKVKQDICPEYIWSKKERPIHAASYDPGKEENYNRGKLDQGRKPLSYAGLKNQTEEIVYDEKVIMGADGGKHPMNRPFIQSIDNTAFFNQYKERSKRKKATAAVREERQKLLEAENLTNNTTVKMEKVNPSTITLSQRNYSTQ